MRLRSRILGTSALLVLTAMPSAGNPPGEQVLFESPTVGVGDLHPRPSAAADFDGDGILDIAVGNGPFDQVTILHGAGDGTFTVTGHYTPSGSEVNAVATADMNADGLIDVVAATSSGGIAILSGNGDGTFDPPVVSTAGDNPSALAIADFSGDGLPDVIAANQWSDDISYFQNAAGALQPQTRIPVGDEPVGIAAGDVNGDGKQDVLVILGTGGAFAVLLGNGAGMFPSASLVPVGGEGIGLALGHVDG